MHLSIISFFILSSITSLSYGISQFFIVFLKATNPHTLIFTDKRSEVLFLNLQFKLLISFILILIYDKISPRSYYIIIFLCSAYNKFHYFSIIPFD